MLGWRGVGGGRLPGSYAYFGARSGRVRVVLFLYLFYVEPVGDVCLATGRALGCLMVLFLGGRAGMTRSLIMSLTVDLVSP